MKPGSRPRKLLAIGTLLLLLLLIAGGSIAAKRSARVEFKLADGRIVELIGVTTGHDHRLQNSTLRDLVYKYSPGGVRRALGPNFKSTLNFPSGGMALWFMLYDPPLKGYISHNWANRIIAIDEHGCEMPSGGSGHVGDGNYMATVFHLSAFPRRQESFTCRLINIVNGVTNVLGDLNIKNPFPVSTVQLLPEALPITRTNDPLVVRLNSISKNSHGYTEIGDEKTQYVWSTRYHHFEDATGNQGDFLCRNETWKWVATFFRSEDADFQTNEIWTFENFTSPKPGEIRSVNSTNLLADYPLQILYMGGPGTYRFSNSVCVSASASISGGVGWKASVTNGKTNFITTTVGSSTPFAIIEHEKLGKESELMMRLRDGDKIVALVQDAQGSHPYWPHKWQHYALVHHRPETTPWPTNKPLTLDIIVQRGRKFEFPIAALPLEQK